MNKNKKGGMPINKIMRIVLLMVALVLIAWQLSEFLAKAEPKEAEIICQNSISMRAASTIQLDSTLVKANLKLVLDLCNTIDLKIT